MRNNFGLLLSAAVLIMVAVACVHRPEGVLSDKKMAPVVADLELAEVYIERLPESKARDQRDRVVEYVIAKHGISREEFDSTMSWYGRNVDDYYKFCDLVEKELQKKKRKVSGSTSIEIETSDIWPYPRKLYLSLLDDSKGFTFDIPTATIESGNRLNMLFKLNNQASGNMLLGVEYDKGPNSYVSKKIRESKRVDLTLQTDSARTVTRVFGNFMLLDSRRLPLWLDSIYLKALPFDSVEYFKIHSQRSSN